jgi:hypothetical protein
MNKKQTTKLLAALCVLAHCIKTTDSNIGHKEMLMMILWDLQEDFGFDFYDRSVNDYVKSLKNDQVMKNDIKKKRNIQFFD